MDLGSDPLWRSLGSPWHLHSDPHATVVGLEG